MTERITRFRRVGTATAFLLAGTLFFAGVVVAPWEAEDSEEARREAYVGDPQGILLSATLLHYAFLAYAVALFGALALLRRARWPVAAHVVAVLAALGFASMAGFIVIDFFDLAVGQSLDAERAKAMDEALESYWAVPAVTAAWGPLAILGFPATLAFLWRAGWLPGYVPALSLVGTVGSLVTPPGLVYMSAWSAVGLVVNGLVAWRILRTTDEAWERGTPDEAPAARASASAAEA